MPGPSPEQPVWYRLTLRTREADLACIGAVLTDHGAIGIEEVDESHPAPPADLPPGATEIRGWFTQDPAGPGRLEELRAGLQRSFEELGGRLLGAPRVDRVTPEDWADNWKRHFPPVREGRFYIHPGWIQPPPGERFAVRIDPGMAFGTGLHPTTRLTLAAIDRLLPVDSMLDLGCGSGILSLAAARAGVPRVVAVDNDPEAVRATAENSRRNDLGFIRVIHGRIDAVEGRYRLVAANILSSVLLHIAPQIPGHLEDGGHLLLSGLMREERDELLAAYARLGLYLVEQHEEDAWSLLHLTRAAPP